MPWSSIWNSFLGKFVGSNQTVKCFSKIERDRFSLNALKSFSMCFKLLYTADGGSTDLWVRQAQSLSVPPQKHSGIILTSHLLLKKQKGTGVSSPVQFS